MSGAYQTIFVQPGNAATKLVDHGEVCTLINADPSNSVTLGDTDNVQTTDPQTTPFTAGQVAVFSHETWALAPPGQTVAIYKYRGVQFLSGVSPQSQSASPPIVFSQTAALGVTKGLVGGSFGYPNPNGFAIQLLAACLTSFSSGTPSVGFNVQDQIQSVTGKPYLQCDIGQAAVQGQALLSVSMQFEQALITSGQLQLMNAGSGGASGVIRNCSATVVFYLINPS